GCLAPAGDFTANAASLRPGDQASATFVAANVGSLGGTLSVPAAVVISTGGKGVCPAESVTVVAGSFDASLPAGDSTGVPVTATLASGAPDGCQGATFAVDIPFRLSSASFVDQV